MPVPGGSPKPVPVNRALTRSQVQAYFQRQEARLAGLAGEVNSVSNLASAKTALQHMVVAIGELLYNDKKLALRLYPKG